MPIADIFDVYHHGSPEANELYKAAKQFPIHAFITDQGRTPHCLCEFEFMVIALLGGGAVYFKG
jgi:hypothetical protein